MIPFYVDSLREENGRIEKQIQRLRGELGDSCGRLPNIVLGEIKSLMERKARNERGIAGNPQEQYTVYIEYRDRKLDSLGTTLQEMADKYEKAMGR